MILSNRGGPTFSQLCVHFLCFAILFGNPLGIGAQADNSSAARDDGAKLDQDSLDIGSELPGFALKDFRGKVMSAEQAANKPVVVFFFGVECPLVRLYASRLKELDEKFSTEEIQWIGINSNQHDSLKEIEHFIKETETEFTLLKDPGNTVADAFGATRTPEVFFFDADHKLRYRGAIDDQYTYGQQRAKVGDTFLADAIAAMKDGTKLETKTTPAVGCIIGRKMEADPNSPVTYSNQISRIIQGHCLSCHRPGEIAPFSLTDYDEVVGWAEMIQEVVDDRRMPPWHASPKHGSFQNDVSLSSKQVSQIKDWVAAGAPEGDKADLPQSITFTEGWQIGEPDVIIPMTKTPFKVPATGVIDYKHFEVDPGFKEDKWISAAELRIGNRAVVHHIIVATSDRRRASKEVRAKHGDVRSQWLTATAPGSPPLQLPDGYAKFIPAGSKLIFQMHYTPNGTPQTDISSVGFKFADPATVKRAVGTREIIEEDFRIPAGADNHKVTASFRFRKDSLILSMFPHMHMRGKSFRYLAEYPDGKSEILLDVPNFDFNWQNGYLFKEPKRMPAGTRIVCTAHYDNSEGNFSNPNPNRTVRWGDQTWDEMMIGYFDMAVDD